MDMDSPLCVIILVILCFTRSVNGVSQVSCPVSCSQCPCFTVGPFEFNIDENTPVGTSIATLTATPGSSITYSSELSVFNMDSVTGVLSVGESLDYETQSTYQFRVEAEEDTYQGRRDITITILNRNEFPPQCSEGLVHFSVLENQNSAFFQLPNCTDGDFLTAPVFTYYITNFSDDVFTVDDNGLFSILQPLDYETSDFYHLSIVVTDSDIPPGFMNTTIRAIVTVQPENEFSPVFAASQFTIEVSENTTIGSVIGRVNATDSDRGSDGMVVYTIAIGQTDVFVINEKTGCLILARTLDFETDISHHFSVVATDNSADIMSRQSATAGVTISILDSNDNPPVFTSPFYHTEVSENTQPGTLLTQLACADLDSGINKELLYFITSGNEESRFNVGTSSGNVTLTSSLDYDNPTNSDFVALTIQCQEVAAPNRISSTQLLIIVTSYNMFNPQPNSIELTVSVPENATPGTLIATVVANDRDRGPGGILRYYINKDLMQSSSCRFEHIAIDETSGNVYLISPLDFENGANEMYCVVTIWDSGYPEKASRVDLFVSVTDVNDNKPRCFPSVSAVYIAEDSMIGGTVFSLPCNDTDSPSLQYTILYPSFQPFDIDSTGSLILQSPLDYETEPFYLLSIQVSDGIFVTNVTIRVIVEPVNEHIPIFSRSVYYCSVEENSLIGTALPCNIIASDQDSGMDGKVHYRLLSSGPFSFNYGDELVLSANIDFEDQHEFLLEIEAFDLGTPSLNSTTTVNVTVVDKNDNHPRMQRILSASISENSLNGTTVTNLTCTDLDQSLNGETEVELLNTFQLTSNEFVDITNLQRFGINASKVFVSGNFNFEISSQYKITVICSDHGVPRLFTTSTLLVNIDPENEYPPVFSNPSLSIAVSEGTNIGTVIATVTATDQDSGEHGRINFSLLSTTDEQLPFDISESSGEIILWNPLNCELKVQYTFYVVAEDGGLPSLSSQSISMINVTNCHLGNVVPDYYTYSMNVVENAALGEAVGSISCSSTRVNVSTDIRPMFRFVNSDSSNFQINSTNGEITIVNSPDFELQSNYKIVVECYDPNYTSVASNVSVFIRVLPVNEFVPEFSDNNIRLNVTENSPYGTLIFHLLASDQDHGLDGQVEFLIASKDSFKAIVNQHTGEVYLATSLDRETTNEMTFTAIARDSSANETLRKSTTILVTITVRDENDNWPQCAPIVHHLVVSPRTEPPYEMVGTFACTDSDINENAQLMYQFSDDLVPADLFELQSDSLYLTGKLNTSGPSHYYLPISVRDRGTPSLASNVLVIVDVQEPDVIGADSSDHAALVEVEGLKNAVWIQLRNISLVLWESMSAEEKFQKVVATSVTHYCALLPEACSLASGCSEFFGTLRKRSISESYLRFNELSVVVLSDDTFPTGATSLNIHFYVVLPIEGNRSPNRQTNYVVPGATLNLLVREDRQTIEAVVRDSVAQQQAIVQGVPDWIIGTLVVCGVVGIVIFAIFVILVCKAVKKHLQRKKVVLPGDTRSQESETTVNSSKRQSFTSSLSGVSNRATCDVPNKSWSISKLQQFVRGRNAESSFRATLSEPTSKGDSRTSSVLSTGAFCDGNHGSSNVPGVFFAPTTTDFDDDDLSEILLDDDYQHSSGRTSMENVPSHTQQGNAPRNLVTKLLSRKGANLSHTPPRPSLKYPVPKWN